MLALRNLNSDVSSSRVQDLDAGYVEDCAAIHAKGFLHPWSATDFEALLSEPACVALGLMEGLAVGKPKAPKIQLKGFIIAKIAAEEAEILTFAVDPLYQKQGIGSRLLDTLKSEMVSKKVSQLFLEVDEANGAARALYEKSGFKIVGIRKSYYRANDDRRSNALIMMAELLSAVSSYDIDICDHVGRHVR